MRYRDFIARANSGEGTPLDNSVGRISTAFQLRFVDGRKVARRIRHRNALAGRLPLGGYARSPVDHAQSKPLTLGASSSSDDREDDLRSSQQMYASNIIGARTD